MAKERDYVLGTHAEEIERLGTQHTIWRPHATLAWVRVDPGYQSLRGDPRFDALMRRLNLPDP